jgi:hypothetical protein
VEKKKEKEVYAMKEMSKARVMAKKSVQSVMNELKLLSQMRSPYEITSALYFFQISCEHALRFSRQRKLVSGHGFATWW